MFTPVSVIIPCFNSSNTIARAVESVANQSHRPAEVILVDDASTDNSLEVIHCLQRKYGENWLKVIKLTNNAGPASARNIGWDIADQPFLAFLDADDSWHPEKLRIQYDWMAAHEQIALCGHAYKIISADDSNAVAKIVQPFESTTITRQAILRSNPLSSPCVMVKTTLPYRFPSNRYYSEDYSLWLNIVLDGMFATFLHTPLTFLYKNAWGKSGLSSKLWQMEKSELQNFRDAYNVSRINSLEFAFASSWSFLKFIRRSLIRLFHQ